jgi:hypothetical protein
MDSERLLTLALALVCLFVVGSAAGSLESAVDSSPSEAIDLDYSSLPLDGSEAGEIERTYYRLTEDSGSASVEPNEQQSESDASQRPRDETDRRDSSAGPSAGSSSESMQSGASGASSSSESGASGSGESGADPSESAIESLLGLLRSLLSRLVAPLVALVTLLSLALAVRYSDRITDRLRSMFGIEDRRAADVERRSRGDDTPPARPRNEVAEAWYEMVQYQKLDAERPLTPRERAALAQRNGADANAVWSLTELFEEVTYGGAPVTEERRQRAQEHLKRLRRSEGVEGS